MFKKIIIGPGYPLRGGISESNQALYNAFKNNMEDVNIISYSLQYPKILFPGKKQFMDNIDKDVDGVKHLINTLNPLSWFKTARHIIQEKPQYVIVRYWHPYFAFCLSIICKILSKKSIFIIAWIDNVHPHESIPFQKLLTSYFLDSCDAFFVMSNSVKRDLLNYIEGDKKIYLSPHPVYNVFGDLVKKQEARKIIGLPSSNLRDKYILFFGLVRKYKGLDLLLDVMASSQVQQLSINLIIAGEFYDSKDKYLKKINHLKLKNRIFLYDSYIPNRDVANYFCAADMVVQPYLSATQSGVSMIAYNFNKPIILTNVGGLSEYVQHQKDGYLVDVNVDSIVEALVDFYQNNREDSFAKAVKQKQVNYNWSNFAKKFNSLYDESDYS